MLLAGAGEKLCNAALEAVAAALEWIVFKRLGNCCVRGVFVTGKTALKGCLAEGFFTVLRKIDSGEVVKSSC